MASLKFLLLAALPLMVYAKAEKLASTSPMTSKEYQAIIGWGFDTDTFKSVNGMKKYDIQILKDLKAKGVTNLRLRSRADIFGYATDTYNDASMQQYLTDVNTYVTDMISLGMVPIISWIHHDAEVRASTVDGNNYVDWWTRTATALKDQPYELAFNLFTELTEGGIYQDTSIYNDWTRRAIAAIRASGGNNAKRVLILGAPRKDADTLQDIAADITADPTYLMAEWHLYASGPNKKLLNNGRESQKYWAGTGSAVDRARLTSVLDIAQAWSTSSGIPTWFGAWMPYDNKEGDLEQGEVEDFACFFDLTLKKYGIPWSMNKMENFYDRKAKTWIPTSTIGQGGSVTLQMAPILSAATSCAAMPPERFSFASHKQESLHAYLEKQQAAQRRAAQHGKHQVHRKMVASETA